MIRDHRHERVMHFWVTYLGPKFDFVLFADGESLFSALSSEEFGKSEKNHLPNSHKWKGGEFKK